MANECSAGFACELSSSQPPPGGSDALALARALERHRALLHSIAERILGSGDLARDAVQETLVALWQAPEPPANPRAWLVRTVLHRSLHARRTEGRRRKWEQLAGEDWAQSCPICDPERDAVNRELHRDIEEALALLSSDQRLAFALREFEGLDYAEIAERLGVPIGTIRSRLNRARSSLRKGLRGA